MTISRCKYGYSGGLNAEWGQWLDLGDGTFDQCRRQEHGEYGLSWHFPESGAAVSKHGKRIDDPEKWVPLWENMLAWEGSDKRSLFMYLHQVITGSGDVLLSGWWDRWTITPNAARHLLAFANGESGDSPKFAPYLRQRRLISEGRPTELTPIGITMVRILRGWDRA